MAYSVGDSKGQASLRDLIKQGLTNQVQSLMEDHVQITLTAEPEMTDDESLQINVPTDTMSMLLFQTLLHKVCHLEAIDPCSALSNESFPEQTSSSSHQLMGSLPFYHIETFEDLFQHAVYPFVEFAGPEQDWTSRRRSGDSQSARALAPHGASGSSQLTIEFCDIP